MTRPADGMTGERNLHDCGHACCDERHDPLHDHYLNSDQCPQCIRVNREHPSHTNHNHNTEGPT